MSLILEKVRKLLVGKNNQFLKKKNQELVGISVVIIGRPHPMLQPYS